MSQNREAGGNAAQRARSLLLTVFEEMKRSGRAPTAEEFFPVDLKIVAGALGWKIERVSEIGTSHDGRRVLGRCDYVNRKLLIASDAAAGPEQERFTLAHEIAHASLGHNSSCLSMPDDRPKPQSFRRLLQRDPDPEASRTEREANNFATELLMPERAVRKQFKAIFGREKLWAEQQTVRNIVLSLHHTIPQPGAVRPADVSPGLAIWKKPGETKSLAEFFGVSKSAMSRRLLQLELVHS